MKTQFLSSLSNPFTKTVILLFTLIYSRSYCQDKVISFLTGKTTTLRQSTIYTNAGDSIFCFIEQFDNKHILYKLKPEDDESKTIYGRDIKEFTVLSRWYERVMIDSSGYMFLEVMEKGKLMFYRKVYTHLVVEPIGHTYGSYGKTYDEEENYIRTSGKNDCIELTGSKKKRYAQILPYVQDNPEAVRRIEKKIYGLKEMYLLIAYYNKWYNDQNSSSK